MKDFSRGDRFGGRKRESSFGGGHGSSGRSQMFPAVCDECGANCMVPFRPTGDKPVYCSDCFSQHGHDDRGRGGDRFEKRSFDRGGDFRREKKMFDAVCDKCHEACQVPFRPNGEKPVYCDKCFDRGSVSTLHDFSKAGKANDSMAKGIEIINAKLNKIMKALNIVDEVKSEDKPKAKNPVTDLNLDIVFPAEEKAAVKTKKVAKKETVKKVSKKAKK